MANDDDKLNRIEDKIDTIVAHTASIDVTLAKQHEQLAYHIKRTNLIEEQLEPIKKHVNMVHGALKLIGVLSVLASIAEVVFKLLGN